MPGLLEVAIAPFTPQGLRIPWYSAYGNHDGLVQGNAPQNAVFEAISTGPVKITSRPAGVTSADLIDGLQAQDPGALAALASAPGRPVTADARRAYVSPQEWIQAHLDSSTAARSNGHGYTEDALESGILYYTFRSPTACSASASTRPTGAGRRRDRSGRRSSTGSRRDWSRRTGGTSTPAAPRSSPATRTSSWCCSATTTSRR
jgi:hypothetical protein